MMTLAFKGSIDAKWTAFAAACLMYCAQGIAQPGMPGSPAAAPAAPPSVPGAATPPAAPIAPVPVMGQPSMPPEPGLRNWARETKTSVLWPGEQVSCHNLTVRWKFEEPSATAPNALGAPGAPGAPGFPGLNPMMGTADAADPHSPFGEREVTRGALIITGPKGVDEEISLPMAKGAVSKWPLNKPSEAYYYAADTVLNFTLDPADRPGKVSITYWQQPSQIEIGGSKNQRSNLFVSQALPVSLGSLNLSVSGEPRTYPDGSRYHELFLNDPSNGTSVSMPLANGSIRTVGRFNIGFGEFTMPSKTAVLGVEADIDYTTRGLRTIIPHKITLVEGENYGQLFDRLGKAYGFSVKWMDAEGFPGSGEKAKLSDSELRSLYWELPVNYSVARLALFELLQAHLSSNQWVAGPPLEFRYVSDNELIVRPTRTRITKQEELTRDTREREELPQIFATQYTATNQIYPVDPQSATTANTLIQQELNTYVMATGSQPLKTEASKRVVHDGVSMDIIALPAAAAVSGITSVTREFVVHDEKANVLIANVIPATHKKIEEILQKVKSLVDLPAAPAAPAKSYRVDLVLLEGIKSETKLTSPTVDPKDFGLTVEDLKLFGFNSLVQLGSGVVNMVAQPGKSSNAKVVLSDVYGAELEVVDYRKPYVIMRGSLEGVDMPTGNNLKVTRTLLENTLYLEPGKPTLLGLTNFKQALILIVKVRE